MNSGLREQLWALLGDLPAPERAISCELIASEQRDGYQLDTLVLDLNGMESVAAYFVRPADASGALPAVLYHHSHGANFALGKEELITGHAGVLVEEPWAVSLTRAGYAALCIDAWSFGTRQRRSEHDDVKACLWQGQTLWGLRMYDAVRALDYLCMRPDVDASRIATVGMSMGSTMAWWLAALDTRIKVCAEECGLTDYRVLLEEGRLAEHNFYYYVPGLLKLCNSPDIMALIAPRAHLACVGEADPKTPAAGVSQIDAILKARYAACGAPDAWQLLREAGGHGESHSMREQVLRFLRLHL